MGGSPPTLGEVIDPREVVVDVTVVFWEDIASGEDVTLVLGVALMLEVVLMLEVEVIVTGGGGSFRCFGGLPRFRFTGCCCCG